MTCMIPPMEKPPTAGSLEALQFDNRFTCALPEDSSDANYPRQVMRACYSMVRPHEAKAPKLVAYSKEVATDLLSLSESACEEQLFTDVFSGKVLLAGSEPFAMCYGGHQFGNWAGQLGDGRAINLGEIKAVDGKHWFLQLKGAGPTPYSRSGDGFAVLRSSVREFLCSEAMFHLGVPTTRALSLVTTGEGILRDMFYDGNAQTEPGAVVCRVARSFTRFGSFQIFAAREEHDAMRELLDHTIRADFPHLGEPCPGSYAKWFQEVCDSTSQMIIQWMRVGFVHGVMNTDNMSVLGDTIDYGPYGWLEDFDFDWTPNTTDAGQRRYSFGNQPSIAHWNLVQLANAIAPLFDGELDPLRETLSNYAEKYLADHRSMMLGKLGLNCGDAESDQALIDELFNVLQLAETDMTIFYRQLAKLDTDTDSLEAQLAVLREATYSADPLAPASKVRTRDWLQLYGDRIRREGLSHTERATRMNAVNPLYVLRNYQAQLAIEASEKGDHSKVNALLDVLRDPYTERAGLEEYAAKRPEWARHRPGCSTLSCSS